MSAEALAKAQDRRIEQCGESPASHRESSWSMPRPTPEETSKPDHCGRATDLVVAHGVSRAIAGLKACATPPPVFCPRLRASAHEELARCDEEEHRQYSTEKQRSQAGCSATRMQRDFHHGLAVKLRLKPTRKTARSLPARSFSQSPATRGLDISGGRRKGCFQRNDVVLRRCVTHWLSSREGERSCLK